MIKARDQGATLRNFADPWWSFSRGEPFVKYKDAYVQHAMNDPCACGCEHRARLLELDFVSTGAREALERAVCKKKIKIDGNDGRALEDQLIVEHLVPIDVVKRHLLTPTFSLPSLRDFMAFHWKRCLLTKAEDKRLDLPVEGKSLHSAMPIGWSPFDDPFVRYRARDIRGSIRAV